MSRATVDAYAFLLHGLRHTCVSIIGTAGVEPKSAQTAWATQASP
jgi:hypothetical protein